jgi:hypothetical protein
LRVAIMISRLIVALALIISITLPGQGQISSIKADRADKLSGEVKSSPFVVGERLSYDVSWSDFIVAGELTLETKERRSIDGVDAYHVVAQAQSVGLVNAIVYKVNDLYESFLNAATLQPFRAEKRSRRGKKREESSIRIDQQGRTAQLADGRSLELPGETYDLAGLIYAVRAMDLAVGKPRAFTLLEDNKLYSMQLEAEGREKITTRSGSYDAIRIGTKIVGNRDKDPYKLRIYLSNDSKRLPVLITAEPSWGQVRVELTSATGTKTK